LSRKFKLDQNLKRLTGTLHKDLSTLISRWVLFRIRDISEKSCRENRNNRFYVQWMFPKTVRFVWECGKICNSQTGHK